MSELKIVWRIMRTDLAVLFYSPIAWFIWIVFSFLTASDYVDKMESSIQFFEMHGNASGESFTYFRFLTYHGFFHSIVSNLYVYIPLLTMGLISRETASGSIKLAYSSPITSGQIVWGKYLAAIVFGLCLMLIPVAGAIHGSLVIENFDWAPVLVGLLGLYLLICAYCAIGLFMSSLTNYQVVAAIGTLAVLAILRFIGTVGQEYDWVREFTYWLSINGRTANMLNGVMRTDDLIYFVVVIGMFIAFTIFKISFARRTISTLWKTAAYAGVIVVALAIGYITSRPALIGVWDATRIKANSLTENSKKVLAQLEGPATITNYVNLLDNASFRYLPMNMKANESIFEPYCLAKQDLKVKYVYYYDVAPGIMQNPRMKGKTFEEIRDYMLVLMKQDPNLYKSPEEIKKIIDLSPLGNTFVRVLQTADGKQAYIRDFNDMTKVPTEAEITAAIKKLVSVAPKVAFLKGDGERFVTKSGDRDYDSFAVNAYSRSALINQGFDVYELDISHGDTIPDAINIMVLAEMRTPLTEEGEKQMEAYLQRGGNLFVLTDVGRQEVMNPFLEKLGVRMEEYQLAQQSEDFSAELVRAKATHEAGELTFGFKDKFPQQKLRVSMPGCVALTLLPEKNGFRPIPVLETEAKGVWTEKETTDLKTTTLTCNADAGETEGTFVTAYGLVREVDGKEQRILITGDADCMSNAELNTGRDGYRSGNFDLIIESFRWLSGGEFPIDVRRPAATDTRYKVTVEHTPVMKGLFLVAIPAILVIVGVGIWFFRRRH